MCILIDDFWPGKVKNITRGALRCGTLVEMHEMTFMMLETIEWQHYLDMEVALFTNDAQGGDGIDIIPISRQIGN